MSNITIRTAGEGDIEAIRRVSTCTWPVAYHGVITDEQIAYMLSLMYSPESLRNQMLHSGHLFIVAESEDGILGFASSGMNTDCVFRLHKLYVLPPYQRTGTGKALLNSVISAAVSQGAMDLELNVNRKNPSLKFYLSQGFTIYKEEDIDIGNGFFMNDFVLRKRLI